MSNVLPLETRLRIVAALVEGNSIRAASRLTAVGKNTVMNLALSVGEGCARLHNALVRRLSSYDVECDETWSFISKKEARCDPEKDPAEWGDVYSFLALDATIKDRDLVPRRQAQRTEHRRLHCRSARSSVRRAANRFRRLPTLHFSHRRWVRIFCGGRKPTDFV